MRRIAADLGAPTTGFVRRKSDRDYIVRFFSGRNEMAMCGHVTVAIFACLADDGRISVDGGFYRQRTAAGEISVEVTEHNGRPQVVVHQPLPKFDSIQLDGATLVGPLGLDPQKVVSFGSVSAALNHFFLEVLDEETLGTIRTDDHVLRLISKQHRIDTVCVWCRRGVMTQAFGYGIFVTALVIRKKRHLGRPMQRSPVFYGAPELCRDFGKVALKSKPNKVMRWADPAGFARL